MKWFDGDAGYVVQGHETDSEPCIRDFGFGLRQDVSARPTSFRSFRAQHGSDRPELGDKMRVVCLFISLVGGCCAVEAFGAESGNSFV